MNNIMNAENFEIPRNLEVHPLGDNGEMEILPADEKNILSCSRLPCGLPPILPDTNEMLNSFLENPEKLPILHLDAVQRFIDIEPNVSSLYTMNLCPLQTTLTVKRNMMTGKILGFSEEVKDVFQGTHNTTTSLSRAPGPPEAGVRGSTSSYPFHPGGMDEPWFERLTPKDINLELFQGEFLDTPPGFKSGMKFERKNYDHVDYIKSQPQKIYLSDVLAMDDSLDFEILNESDYKAEDDVDLEKMQQETEKESTEIDDAIMKIASLPVLNISETDLKKPRVEYEWAVVEDVNVPIDDFAEKIPKMACTWPFELDVFQKRAVLHLEKRESVFVAAHTSAGKTVVAEYAIALAKKNVTRVIYTSPIKALSNQKYREFKEKFDDVGLITGDVQINPAAFCLIMTTEILRSMLYHGSDVVRELEWVIFDEVHYINDSERGVVWEEVFIMLPDHVNLIMLSATVPNTAEFAEWLGRIKKRKIYVISTLKRPVPLVYHLYTGSVGKSENEMFDIVDKNGRYLDNGYMEAYKAKKSRESKSKSSTGPKGQKFHISVAQEKNVYIGLLGYLQKKDKLPAVCFTFSRKRCNTHAENLKSENLTTQKEKQKIVKFFGESMAKLKKEDQLLPQIRVTKEHLERGIGVHHSGILPILKEVVEMLFQKGLVKVLFATETFAMGVNMPASAVVFDSICKHDGISLRELQPSEFIQMAGRAGRRGHDEEGTVVVLCKGDVPESISLRTMMLGKPAKLQSQFKLTYSMILNLLKIKTFSVEDVMKRSFGESNNHKMRKDWEKMLTDASERYKKLPQSDCSLCRVDMKKYVVALSEAKKLRKKILQKKCSQALASKIFVTGRILVISTEQQENIPCVLLNIDKGNKCKVLAISEKKKTDDSCEKNILPWTKQIFYPSEKQPCVMTISFENVQIITNKAIRIQENEVLKEWKIFEIAGSNPGYCISSAFQELCSISEANLGGFPSANLNFKDMALVEEALLLENIERSFESYTCIKCPQFSKHFYEISLQEDLSDKIHTYKHKLSNEGLTLHPEYEMRKDVLKTLGYIDEEDNVQLKGSVAREMSNHELLITELLVKSVFNDCPPEEVAALLSCMVVQQKCDDSELELPSHLLAKIKVIRDVAKEIAYTQERAGIQEPRFVEQYNFSLANVVYEWAKGTVFAEIMQSTEIDEGIIVRSIQRLSELLKDVRNGASLVGDTVLAKKMEEASHKIKRDIVFAASLYVQ